MGQQRKREVERMARVRAVAFGRWTRPTGLTRKEAAVKIGLLPGTLGTWDRRWRLDRLRAKPRGRPAERADAETRQALFAVFDVTGPGVGLVSLQAMLPHVPRRELEDLLRRYRRVYLKAKRRLLHVLRWHHAGRVWAMDYTDPPSPVDGLYEDVLAGRDLPSGNQLAALPVPRECGRASADAMEELFKKHGPPLVVKTDNGSPLACEEVEKVLERYGVFPLLSPPRYPRYNGACEAGIGWLQTRAHYEAARHGRPGEWTCDDLEAARQAGNELGRPWGRLAPTPDLAWRSRMPITRAERYLFRAAVERLRKELRKEMGILPGMESERPTRSAVDRVAISRALIERGYLSIRRRRISLPFRTLFRRKIS